MRRLNRWSLVSLLLVIPVAGCLRASITESMFFHPTSTRTVAPYVREDLSLTAKDGTRLRGCFLKHPEARGTLLNFGGNAEQVVLSSDLFEALEPLKLNVVMVDYRGYGESEGKPNAERLLSDAMDIYEYLKGRPDVDARKIFVRGMSLGSFPAIRIAQTQPVAGLLLEGAGTNVSDFVESQTPWYLVPFLRYEVEGKLYALDNAQAIRSATSPTLILVGDRDSETPPFMAKKLLAASASRRKSVHVIAGGYHAGLFRRSEYLPLVAAFVDESLAGSESR